VATGFGVIDLGPKRKHRVIDFGVIRPPVQTVLDRLKG